MPQNDRMDDLLDRLKTALADRYRIERELGAGGMATVYLAEDLKHQRQVAVKVLRPELAAALGPDRFLREITTTANLRHPHILPLYDSGRAGGPVGRRADSADESSANGQRPTADILFYVMPYVEGETLRDRLDREKQLPLDDALRIAREVADALSYAHSRGVIHRDIKPENILLESGHAVVADFGIARAVDAAGGDRLTETGLAVGTPTYMSPEQAAGEGELDGRSDLYALGCVLYEMLAGQPPFTGPNVEAVIRQHLTAVPIPITQIRPAVPAAIAGVLQRALAKTPADRFNPVAQFAEALHRPVAGAPTGGIRLSRRALLGVATVVVVSVLATMLVLGNRDRPEPIPTIGRTVQVTRDPGLEVDPSLSPDGQLVAYAAGPPTHMQIFVRQTAGGRTVQLTTDSSVNHRWPRFSPDGSRIAFQADRGIYVVPALGGPPRLLARVPESDMVLSRGSWVAPIAGLTWSPDGQRIAFVGSYSANELYIVDADGGEVGRLDTPPEPHSPAWSPDGTRIAIASGNPAFVFGMTYFGNIGTSSLWIVPVDGGPMARVTDGTTSDESPQWLPDGQHLFFVSDRGGTRDVYRVRVDRSGAPTGAPVRITTGLDVQTIALTPDGGHLAHAQLRSTSNIWSLPIPRAGPVSASSAQPVTTGDQMIEDVDVAPDGSWLVFDSDRNGNADIYKLAVAGGEPIPLTRDSAGDFSAAWSPDGKRVAFHSLRTGNRDLFTVEADGTGLTRRTSSPLQELDPDWSPTGDALVAEVIDTVGSRSASFVIVPLEETGSESRRLAATGDFAAWSPTGDIAYHAIDGVRVIRPDSGVPRLLASNAEDGSEAFYTAWSPDGGTLYYLAKGETGWVIRAVPRLGGPSRTVVRFDDPSRQPTRYGFTTDGKTFYFTVGSHESDVWVMNLEN